MGWRTQLRALLGVLVLLLAGGVAWYVTRQRVQTVAPPVSLRTDEKCDSEISGDTHERTRNGKIVFRLKYDYGCTITAQSRVRLVKVAGTLIRDNDPVEFTAGEANLTLKPGGGIDFEKFDEMAMRGGVIIKSGKRLYLETAEATYNDVTGMMTTEKPVKIRRDNMNGSGTGATFDRNRNVVWLLANARINIVTSGQGTLSVTSSRAGLAETENYMRFEENVRMEREGRLIETDGAVANLTPDGKGITGLELRGKSRITGAPSGGGGVPNMSADDITITYGAESGLLERAVLMRAARLELPEGNGRSLAAGFIDIGFGGDGSTVTALDANEAVQLRIPADRDQPAREIDAPRLEARGAVPKGLERAQFSGNVEFREKGPARGSAPAVDRTGRSESLTLGLDGGFGKIKDADFAGNVRFRDRDITGEAPEAQYGVDSKRVALHGGAGFARIIQDDGVIDAKDIDLTLEPRKLTAKGNVRSTLKPGARKDRNGTRPSILEDDEPVNVTARTLDYDGTTERAVYGGDARLWQGDTVIQAETIVLDDKSGNLEARKNVRAQFLIREQPVAGAKTAPDKKPAPTLANAEELIYEESQRKATFRQSARLRGPEGNISADRIEMILLEDGNTLDRAEAYGKVTARLEGERVATGDRLTYKAAARHYDMSGKPLTVLQQIDDKGQKRCEKTEGASLTFDRSADTVNVRGANGAQSRAVGVPCTAAKDPRP